MEKRKVLLAAAIAGLFAAGAVMNQAAPAFADETQAPAGDKASCKGGSCKGEEAAAKGGDAAAPAAKTDDAAAKPKKGKHAGKKGKKKPKTDAPAS